MKSIVKNTRCSNQTQSHLTLKNQKEMNILLNNPKLTSTMDMRIKIEIEKRRTDFLDKEFKDLKLKKEMPTKTVILGLNKILSKKEMNRLWETKNSGQKYFYRLQDLVEIGLEPKSIQPHLLCLKKEM